MNRKNNEKTIQVTTTILVSDYESIKTLSATTHKPMAEIIRDYILKGMHVEKTKGDIDFIRKNIREELNSVMDGYMNRIIKLIVKVGTITITMCFFTSKLTYILISKYKGNLTYDEMLNESKRKSAVFLGMKDKSIDELCKSILNDKDGNNFDDEDNKFFND